MNQGEQWMKVELRVAQLVEMWTKEVFAEHRLEKE